MEKEHTHIRTHYKKYFNIIYYVKNIVTEIRIKYIACNVEEQVAEFFKRTCVRERGAVEGGTDFGRKRLAAGVARNNNVFGVRAKKKRRRMHYLLARASVQS